jgi:hypothetical protein
MATFKGTGGDDDLDGRTYLVVDAGSDTAYQAGSDYVFDITGFSGTVTTGDFIQHCHSRPSSATAARGREPG